MDHLECPTHKIWEARRNWFERLNDEISGNGSYLVSEQACALIAEVQSVFCTGAWIAVLILAIAVVDAQLRETEMPEFKGSTKQLLDKINADKDLHTLRIRRNSIVHVDLEHPAITVDQQWSNRNELELEARKAVKLMLETFYISPGI
jgi:hypothetical protein